MMWIYCFISLTIFLILMIIYLFRHKRKKNISKPLRIIVWGTGILTLVLLAVSCFMPEDTQSNKISQKEQTEFFRISTAINNGKFDHILSDIDTLFPPTQNLDSTRQDNRFILLRLYYEKTGDTKKEKQLLEETQKDTSMMSDEVIKKIVENRLNELQ
ncbi:MAG: hypothetical protein ACLUX8_10855 [Clostridium sp.]